MVQTWECRDILANALKELADVNPWDSELYEAQANAVPAHCRDLVARFCLDDAKTVASNMRQHYCESISGAAPLLLEVLTEAQERLHTLYVLARWIALEHDYETATPMSHDFYGALALVRLQDIRAQKLLDGKELLPEDLDLFAPDTASRAAETLLFKDLDRLVREDKRVSEPLRILRDVLRATQTPVPKKIYGEWIRIWVDRLVEARATNHEARLVKGKIFNIRWLQDAVPDFVWPEKERARLMTALADATANALACETYEQFRALHNEATLLALILGVDAEEALAQKRHELLPQLDVCQRRAAGRHSWCVSVPMRTSRSTSSKRGRDVLFSSSATNDLRVYSNPFGIRRPDTDPR